MKFNKLIVALLLIGSVVQAQKIDLNFKNLKISEFIKLVSKITHKNILITSAIKGNIDFVADHGIEKDELFVLLQAILESNFGLSRLE